MFFNSLYQITFLFLILTAMDFIVEYLMQIMVHQGKQLALRTGHPDFSASHYFQKIEDLHHAFR